MHVQGALQIGLKITDPRPKSLHCLRGWDVDGNYEIIVLQRAVAWERATNSKHKLSVQFLTMSIDSAELRSVQHFSNDRWRRCRD